ncbi:hypothetical protein [Pseudoruegeria sp. SHC-113]|uniref:hypothetical protein n=1 Tax=Pseudoruegeria sp. SHC-113 TaxID=2855439 RepID=UPI0021BB228A|nr:hypothetical protein [Pseudoruegeria sp. SHC-113]MCT8161838.1 hypothetical protein [Pseudoruegeria sp. SHC-113]
MNLTKTALLLAIAGGVAACDKQNLGVDRFVDSGDLSKLEAGIWIDPNGCDHWIIDDGAEGYLSQRLDKYGKPVCSGAAPPNTAIGPYKRGTDPI